MSQHVHKLEPWATHEDQYLCECGARASKLEIVGLPPSELTSLLDHRAGMLAIFMAHADGVRRGYIK